MGFSKHPNRSQELIYKKSQVYKPNIYRTCNFRFSIASRNSIWFLLNQKVEY